MNIIIGLLIIAVGSFGQSSSYVPIKKVKDWAWECFWLTQGIFAWLVFPYLGALLTVPAGASLGEILSVTDAGGSMVAWKAMGFGALWGVGGLTFGLSVRYLGVAMGQSLALGTCSAFGTLIPALLKGDNLFHGDGLILLIGVSIAIAGIAVIGYAGSLRNKNMTEEEKRKAVKDFALKKGILIALLAGVMSACFSLGLEAGEPIKAKALAMGANELLALNPVVLLCTIGGFCTNAVFCIFNNVKNGTGKQYFSVPGNILINNLLFCALAGVLWYSQFFGLGMGKSFLQDSPVMLAFSWSILMSLNILFSNVWGILLKEWKGSGRQTVTVLIIGLSILVLSIIFPQLLN
jgi:L-rhamnose-H+ transport protein